MVYLGDVLDEVAQHAAVIGFAAVERREHGHVVAWHVSGIVRGAFLIAETAAAAAESRNSWHLFASVLPISFRGFVISYWAVVADLC